MIKQNPFSLYDFLGYLIPGAIFFYIILLADGNDSITSLADIVKAVSERKEFQFDKILFFIIVSYALGHLISYLSSLTIERFANYKYNYPSKYLLGLTDKSTQYFPKGVRWQITFFRIFLAAVILPVSVLDFILGKHFLFNRFYTKELDPYLVEVIKKKSLVLLSQLYPAGYKDFENHDFHRIISHYVYENTPGHQFKMTNYVALYGFLRALSMLCCGLFWFFVVKCAVSIILYYYRSLTCATRNISITDVDIGLCMYMLLSGAAAYVYYMGFMKFYRRYSLEGYMLVAINTTIAIPSKKIVLPDK